MRNFVDYNPEKRSVVKHFGQVKEQGLLKCVFLKEPGCKKIIELSSSCGCSRPNDFPDRVEVLFQASNIAEHLAAVGHTKQEVSKFVTVTYEDRTSESLELKIQVVKK